MKNSKLRRILLTLACAVLLVSLSVGATLAYLTSTDEVTNTFTVGQIKIELDEADVDEDDLATDVNEGTNHEGRDKANSYKILPDATFDKDPIVWVEAGSEDAYLFIKVLNGVADIEANVTGKPTVEAQILANGWTKLAVDGLAENEAVYYCMFDEETLTADKKDVDWKFATFTKVYISRTIDNDTVLKNQGDTLVVNAYAIQKAGLNDAATAWTALNAQINP